MKHYLIIVCCLLASHTAIAADSMQQLIVQKQYAQAVQTGEQILRQTPNHASTRFLTAYAYQMNGKTDKAIQLYESLIKDEPELPEPRNNLAMIYLEKGDYDHASQLLVSAINTNISYAIAYANLSQVYKGIASEAYRRAISQSDEPAKYTHDIDLTAITWLDNLDTATTTQIASLPTSKAITTDPAVKDPVVKKSAAKKTTVAVIKPAPTLVNVANQETLLIENVRTWAKAWSNKDFAIYTASYAADYRAKFATHSQWVKHRRGRILRPGDIKVEVVDFTVKQRSADTATVDFTQAFSSPGYSDRVVKRLKFKRVGAQWKIASEWVLSVL
jgi:tetratricopeptide (TPR) repeat protein